MKKILIVLLCLSTLMLMIAGCGGVTTAPSKQNDSSETTETQGSPFAGKELSILVSQGWMDSYYDGIIDRFEKEYDVVVDLQTVPADQYFDLLHSKLTSGTLTDIYWIQSNPFAIESNLVEPEKYCMDFTGSDWFDIIPEERRSACMVGDKLYGLMLWTNSPEYIMMYNRTLFEEIGITKTPSTYNELLSICEKIAGKGIIPWFIPGADGWQHQLAFFQIGGVYEQAQPGLYEALNTKKSTFEGNEKCLKCLAK